MYILECANSAKSNCTVRCGRNLQRTLNSEVHSVRACTRPSLVHWSSVSSLAVYNARVLCTFECTTSVYCTFNVPRWVHVHFTLQVHYAPLSALTMYTTRAVKFLHTRCESAVRCAQLVHMYGTEFAACARSALVECTEPTSVTLHFCAETLLQHFFFARQCVSGAKNGSVLHIAVQKNCKFLQLLGTKMCHVATFHARFDARTHRRRLISSKMKVALARMFPLYFGADWKWYARRWSNLCCLAFHATKKVAIIL